MKAMFAKNVVSQFFDPHGTPGKGPSFSPTAPSISPGFLNRFSSKSANKSPFFTVRN